MFFVGIRDCVKTSKKYVSYWTLKEVTHMMLPFEQVSDIWNHDNGGRTAVWTGTIGTFLQEEEKHGICCHKNEQKNSIFAGPWNQLECECMVFGTLPFF